MCDPAKPYGFCWSFLYLLSGISPNEVKITQEIAFSFDLLLLSLWGQLQNLHCAELPSESVLNWSKLYCSLQTYYSPVSICFSSLLHHRKHTTILIFILGLFHLTISLTKGLPWEPSRWALNQCHMWFLNRWLLPEKKSSLFHPPPPNISGHSSPLQSLPRATPFTAFFLL